MDKLYSKYFQKSKTFLLPLVLSSKTGYAQPDNVYLTWEDKYTLKDKKLIVVYKTLNSKVFKGADAVLRASPLFETTEMPVSGEQIVYIFNLSKNTKDYKLFLNGEYSKLSNSLKRKIKIYHGESSKEYQLIDSFLYPHLYFEDYARLLDVDIKLIKSVGEVCDKYNPKKENLVLKLEDLEITEKAV